jgi:hypothetical protein
MRIVRAADTPWQTYAGQRGSGLEYLHYFEGKPGSFDNYEMRLVRWLPGTDYFAPRHHHNFDQFRWPLVGPLNYAKGKDLQVGQLGYFTEGAYYGPQEIPAGTEFMIVQFAGANGEGYMGAEETAQGTEELKTLGEFSRGVYRRTNETGNNVNQDAYEAVWEHVNGRKIAYATPRFEEPLVMNPDGFSWQQEGDDPKVQLKRLGTFTERGTAAALVKVGSGASHAFEPERVIRLLFVTEGEGQVEGGSLTARDAVELQAGEQLDLVATSDITVLVMTLPGFAV